MGSKQLLPKMEITKKFEFNGMHIVRNCSSARCKYSMHAHTYQVLLTFTSNKLDNGQMIMDFGLMKKSIKPIINIFHNSVSVWNHVDDKEYIDGVRKRFKRIVYMSDSPSAELYSQLFFKLVEAVLNKTKFSNDEGDIDLIRVQVFETLTGSATSHEACDELKSDDIVLSDELSEELGFDILDLVDDKIDVLFEHKPVELQLRIR